MRNISIKKKLIMYKITIGPRITLTSAEYEEYFDELQKSNVQSFITEEDALDENDITTSELLLFREEGILCYQADSLVIFDALDLSRHIEAYKKGKYPEDLYKLIFPEI